MGGTPVAKYSGMRPVDIAVYFILFLVVLEVVLELVAPAVRQVRPLLRFSPSTVKDRPVTRFLDHRPGSA